MPRIKPSKCKAIIELSLLFVVIPTVLYFLPLLPVLPILWIFAFLCFTILKKDSGFNRANLWRISAFTGHWRFILIRFGILSVLLFAFVYLIAPDLLFILIKEKPILWLLIILLYPVLSVYPQELIYRAYFFHRYSALFPQRRVLIAMNALLFGYMHIIFHNWVAVLATLIGGAFFATTYNRSRSTFLVSMEHTLYGGLIFTVGMGEFFYNGTVAAMSKSLSF